MSENLTSHSNVDPSLGGHSPHSHSSTSHASTFLVVFAMLLVLTGMSFWIANSHLMDSKLLGWGAMMGVSLAKALLVLLFFMHLWWERAWKYVITLPAIMMAILLVLLLVPDIGMRTEKYSNQRTMNAPVSQTDR